MTSYARTTFVIFFVLACAACEKTDKEEEIKFEGATFGFISKSKATIEVTLHSRRIVVKSSESADEKVLVGYGSQEMDIFPINKDVLAGVEYTIIDTMRYCDMQPPTMAANTLFVDPAVFSKAEYDLIVRFVQSNFKDAITENKLVKWLDDDVLGLDSGGVYHTVYAVVHQKMAAFEKHYKSQENNDHFTIRVDNHMRVARTVDGLMMESGYDYTFRNDTLFYPSFEGVDEAKRMLSYQDNEGRTFSEIAKVLVEVQPQ